MRVGYSEQVLSHKVISDRGYDGFYTDVLLPKTVVASHEVERNLDMLRHIGANIADDSLEVWLDDGDRRKCQDLLHTGSEKMAKIAVSISSGSSRREWPVENFIELISDISHDKSVEWMIIGAGERALRDVCRLEAECPFVINLVNQTSLRETVAAIDVCDIYLGGDTGLMHIAAALDKTGVVISCHPIGADEDHANSPKRFGPWRSSMRVIQPNALPGCEHGCTMPEAHCIREIRVEEVKKQLLLILVDEDHRLS